MPRISIEAMSAALHTKERHSSAAHLDLAKDLRSSEAPGRHPYRSASAPPRRASAVARSDVQEDNSAILKFNSDNQAHQPPNISQYLRIPVGSSPPDGESNMTAATAPIESPLNGASGSSSAPFRITGVPRSRRDIVSNAIRLYKAVSSDDYHVEDVRDLVEEVIQWGRVAQINAVSTEKHALQQLSRNQTEIEQLRTSLKDKEEAMTELRQSNEVLAKYIHQLEARLSVFDVYQPPDMDSDSRYRPQESPRTSNTNGATDDDRGKFIFPMNGDDLNTEEKSTDAGVTADQVQQLSSELLAAAETYAGMQEDLHKAQHDLQVKRHLMDIGKPSWQGPKGVNQEVELRNQVTQANAKLDKATKSHAQSRLDLEKKIKSLARATAPLGRQPTTGNDSFDAKATARSLLNKPAAGAEIYSERESARSPNDVLWRSLGLAQNGEVVPQVTNGFAGASSRDVTPRSDHTFPAPLVTGGDAKDTSMEAEGQAPPMVPQPSSVTDRDALGNDHVPSGGDSRGNSSEPPNDNAIFDPSPSYDEFYKMYAEVATPAQNNSVGSSTNAAVSVQVDANGAKEGDHGSASPLPAPITIAKSPRKSSVVKTPSVQLEKTFNGADPGIQVIREIHLFLKKQNIHMDELDKKNMDIDGNGILYREDMPRAFKELSVDLTVSDKKCGALLDYLQRHELAAGKDSVAIDTLADVLLSGPPQLSAQHVGRRFLTSPTKERSGRLETTANLDHDEQKSAKPSRVLLKRSSSVNVLGAITTDAQMHKMLLGQGKREVTNVQNKLKSGWNDKFHGTNSSKKRAEFGNVFEARRDYTPKYAQAVSSPSPKLKIEKNSNIEAVLKKFAVYCHRYQVDIVGLLQPYDYHGDGFIEKQHVKTALSNLGIAVSTAEVMFICKQFGRANHRGDVQIQDIFHGICQYMDA